MRGQSYWEEWLNHQLKPHRQGMINTPHFMWNSGPQQPSSCASLTSDCLFWSQQYRGCIPIVNLPTGAVKNPRAASTLLFPPVHLARHFSPMAARGCKHTLNGKFGRHLPPHPPRKGMSLKPSLIRLRNFPGLGNLK